METGTIYFFGKNGSLELLIVDTDTDYEEVVKLDGEFVPGVPRTSMSMYAECLKHKTRVSKEFATEWLNQN